MPQASRAIRRAAVRIASCSTVETLEARVLLTTYSVITTADTGAGSLRQAILDANTNPGADAIAFAIPPADPANPPASPLQTITPSSPLPAITDPVSIDGTTQPGYAGAPVIELNGWGLSVGAGNCTIRGLNIHVSSGGTIITITGPGGNVIQGNYLGTTPDGTAAAGDADYGVYVNDSPNNTIGGTNPSQRNVISGSRGLPISAGVLIFGTDSQNNKLLGNYIGTDATGSVAIPNSLGVRFATNAFNNTVGGTTTGSGNLISGNADTDVQLDSSAHDMILNGNLIGTNAAGTAAIGATPNNFGVFVSDSSHNFIGGNIAAARNIISGHVRGLYFSGRLGSRNRVFANYIGTDITGSAAIPNTGGGILSLSDNNVIGGPGAQRNLISGNGGDGIDITGSAATNAIVTGNYIGTDVTGTLDLGNAGSGVFVSAPGALIGNGASGPGNLISGNGVGISIAAAATGTQILGNLIGTKAAGNAALGNTTDGILLSGTTATVGGTVAASRNVISGNGTNGVQITGSGATGNVVIGNYIGTSSTGNAAVPNANDGVFLNGAPNNTIGGSLAGQRNIISGNGTRTDPANPTGSGIEVTSAAGNVISGNYIGTNLSGGTPLSNTLGILVNRGAAVTIGGTTAAAANVISGNALDGISIVGAATTVGATVIGNFIGTNPAGSAAVPNGRDGVAISARFARIGDVVAGSRNIISGNARDGVSLSGANATGAVISGNSIGANAAGTGAILNGTGVAISAGAAGNTVGGIVAGSGNLISGNTLDGVSIAADAGTNNLIQGNFIGVNTSGNAALPNGRDGIMVAGAAQTIGGTAAAAGNVLAANARNGITLAGPAAIGNLVQGNKIGVNAAGTASLANITGVVIQGGATNNTIGGVIAGASNTVSGNTGEGIDLFDAGTTGNLIQGNFIGTDPATTITTMGNGGHGVMIGASASNNSVGGSAAGAANTIAFNAGDGVSIASDGTIPAAGNTHLCQLDLFQHRPRHRSWQRRTHAQRCRRRGHWRNNLQNFPVITAVPATATATTIRFTLNSQPSTAYRIEFFSSPAATGAAAAEGQTFIGAATVTTDTSGNVTGSAPMGVIPLGVLITATATDPQNNTSEFSAAVAVTPANPPFVNGRYFFYNNSAFDANDPTANAADDAAFARDKQALRPGQTATFANYTSYDKGINGVLIDIASLAGTPTADDFSFKVGNDSNPSGWAAAPLRLPSPCGAERGALNRPCGNHLAG